MNKYVRACICVPVAVLKNAILKIEHPRSFRASFVSAYSPLTEVTMERNSALELGKQFRMRSGARIRVRKGAVCKIGDNVCLNIHNHVACHEKILIGNGVQFGPNVQIYDHDHDFRAPGGIWDRQHRTAPVVIEDNVWIGADCIILRGTRIGKNSVIAAGCIIKGDIQEGSRVVQKRQTTVTPI